VSASGDLAGAATASAESVPALARPWRHGSESVGEISERVLEGALTYLAEHVSHFDPYKDGELTGLCEIPLAELGILSRTGLSAPPVNAEFDVFLDLLESTIGRPTYSERPFREPEILVSHLIALAALARAGRIDDAPMRRDFAFLVAVSDLMAPAFAPHRMMELRHALDLFGIEHELPSYDSIYRNSYAACETNPIFASRAAAYIVTHVVFYLTDLGERPAPLPAGEIGALRRRMRRMLGMCLAEKNWDLVAEFLISDYVLGGSVGDSLSVFAWGCLEGAQRQDGAVPGPRAEESADDPAPPTDPDGSYHTTLVTALAALVARRAITTRGF
jgi:uncharacterized protein DUF6895